MLVNKKISSDDTVLINKILLSEQINNLINNKIRFPFSYRLGVFFRKFYEYFKIFYKSFLIEKSILVDKKYHLIQLFKPDVIHFHDSQLNDYDLKTVKKLSMNSNVVFSLHDLWLFTGHCGVPLDCDKYKNWCGSCPDLNLPPAIITDNTKKSITYKYNEINLSKINFLVHSKYVRNTIISLNRFKKDKFNYIKYAIDTSKFKGQDKKALRNQMGIEKDVFILMTNAVGITNNPYKDFDTLYKAFKILVNKYRAKIMLLVVGDKISNFQYGDNIKNILFVDPFPQSNMLIKYYSISDIYVHSSNIETWGLAISEALSCGLPVIASSVGGVIEQVKGLEYDGNQYPLNKYKSNEANGFLFERKNYLMLFELIKWSIENRKDMHQLASNSEKFAKKYLNIDHSVSEYIDYYKFVINSNKS